MPLKAGITGQDNFDYDNENDYPSRCERKIQNMSACA